MTRLSAILLALAALITFQTPARAGFIENFEQAPWGAAPDRVKNLSPVVRDKQNRKEQYELKDSPVQTHYYFFNNKLYTIDFMFNIKPIEEIILLNQAYGPASQQGDKYWWAGRDLTIWSYQTKSSQHVIEVIFNKIAKEEDLFRDLKRQAALLEEQRTRQRLEQEASALAKANATKPRTDSSAKPAKAEPGRAGAEISGPDKMVSNVLESLKKAPPPDPKKSPPLEAGRTEPIFASDKAKTSPKTDGNQTEPAPLTAGREANRTEPPPRAEPVQAKPALPLAERNRTHTPEPDEVAVRPKPLTGPNQTESFVTPDDDLKFERNKTEEKPASEELPLKDISFDALELGFDGVRWGSGADRADVQGLKLVSESGEKKVFENIKYRLQIANEPLLEVQYHYINNKFDLATVKFAPQQGNGLAGAVYTALGPPVTNIGNKNLKTAQWDYPDFELRIEAYVDKPGMLSVRAKAPDSD